MLSRKLVFWRSNWKRVIKYDLYVKFPWIFAHSVQMCAKFSCKNFIDVCQYFEYDAIILRGDVYSWTRCSLLKWQWHHISVLALDRCNLQDGAHLILGKNIVMAALWNRTGHYIFALWFLSFFFYLSFFSSPNLSCCRLDVYHTSTHGVAVVRI